MKRIFIALPIPDMAADRLMSLQGGIPGARWQARENLHITINFLGETDEQQLALLDDALELIAFDPFEVTVNGFGTFDMGKNRGPRILWAGGETTAPLVRLKQKIDHAVRAAGIDFETRNYTPHITIARMNNPPLGKIGRFLQDNNLFKLPPFTADSFVMYESVLRPEGSLYVPLKDYPFSD